MLNQLSQNWLGRAFLILLIVYITYCNQIAGIFFVLSLIVVYSSWETNEPSYLEGFGLVTMSPGPSTVLSPGPSRGPSNVVSPGPSRGPSTVLYPGPSTIENPSTKPNTPPFDQKKLFNMLSYISTDLDSIKNLLASSQASSNKNKPQTTSNTFTFTNPFSTALEGFDLLGVEDTIKRGKSSDWSNLGKNGRYSGNVMPYEESIFTSSGNV